MVGFNYKHNRGHRNVLKQWLCIEVIVMKASNYNFFFPYEPDDSKLIAYNSFSNALALVDKSKHEMLQQFIGAGVPIDDEEFAKQLYVGKFVTDSDCNELDLIRFRMLQSRYNNNALSLTIAPTADCNFRCAYCYEKDVIRPDYMSADVKDAIIKLVEQHAKTISNLSVTWFGGEPLMNLDMVKKISDRLINLCEKENIVYRSNMVTNGYLLTRETVQLLNELKISSLQITLDGCENVHDMRRPLSDGSPTFETIIHNLETCIDILPHVSLRVNIDKHNVASGREVWNILKDKGLLDKVKPYLGKVVSITDEKSKSNCLDTCAFSQEDFNFYSEFYSDNMYMGRYPRGLRNYCGADSISAYTIAADGRVYKCWHDLGDHSNCVGSILECPDVDANEALRLKYILFDPTTDKTCSQCKLLPVCMGGCPYDRIHSVDASSNVCSIYKFTLNNFLSTISQRLKQSVNDKV